MIECGGISPGDLALLMHCNIFDPAVRGGKNIDPGNDLHSLRKELLPDRKRHGAVRRTNVGTRNHHVDPAAAGPFCHIQSKAQRFFRTRGHTDCKHHRMSQPFFRTKFQIRGITDDLIQTMTVFLFFTLAEERRRPHPVKFHTIHIETCEDLLQKCAQFGSDFRNCKIKSVFPQTPFRMVEPEIRVHRRIRAGTEVTVIHADRQTAAPAIPAALIYADLIRAAGPFLKYF